MNLVTKTNNLFLLLLSIMLIVVSCSDDETVEEEEPNAAPVLSLSTSLDEDKYYYEDTIKLAISATAEAGINVINLISSKTDPVYTKTPGETVNSKDITVNITIESSFPIGTNEFSVSVVDDDNQETTEVFKYEVLGTKISDEQSFTWQRIGTADATGGLDDLGLTWNSNTATYAIIKKGAEKLVRLSSENYEALTTSEDLKTTIDDGEDVDEIQEVSAQSNSEYDDLVIGTQTDTETYYIIKINSSTVETGSVGTTITIYGNYKGNL